MKLPLIAAAISFTLVACVSTEQKKIAIASNMAIAIDVAATPAAGQASSTIITLEKIMADPDWFGRSPESWYWGDDSQTVFYQQKRQGNPLRDLVQKKLSSQGNGELVKLTQMHVFADKNAVLNDSGTHEAYAFEGNVFIKELTSQKVQQITYTSAVESSVMFLTNGNIAYRVGNVFYAHDINSAKVIELANLKMTDGEKPALAAPSYIANEQDELIEYVALQQRNKDLRAEQKRQLRVKNSTVTQTNFYLGKDNEVVLASLSPAGDKLVVSIAPKKPADKASDIMPYKKGSEILPFSDLFRYKLIFNTGKTWLDADMYLLTKLPKDKIIISSEHTFASGAFKSHLPYVPNIGVLRFPKGDQFLENLIFKIENSFKVAENLDNMIVFRKKLKTHEYFDLVSDPLDYCPLPWWSCKESYYDNKYKIKYAVETPSNDWMIENAIGIHLWNNFTFNKHSIDFNKIHNQSLYQKLYDLIYG